MHLYYKRKISNSYLVHHVSLNKIHLILSLTFSPGSYSDCQLCPLSAWCKTSSPEGCGYHAQSSPDALLPTERKCTQWFNHMIALLLYFPSVQRRHTRMGTLVHKQTSRVCISNYIRHCGMQLLTHALDSCFRPNSSYIVRYSEIPIDILLVERFHQHSLSYSTHEFTTQWVSNERRQCFRCGKTTTSWREVWILY